VLLLPVIYMARFGMCLRDECGCDDCGVGAAGGGGDTTVGGGGGGSGEPHTKKKKKKITSARVFIRQ